MWIIVVFGELLFSPTNGNFFAEILGLGVKEEIAHGLYVGECFAQIVSEEIVSLVCIHPYCGNAETLCSIDRAREVEGLGDNNDGLGEEDVASTVHTAVGVEACVVEEYVGTGNAPRHEVEADRIDFVVLERAVVSRDENFFNLFRSIDSNCHVHAVFEYRREDALGRHGGPRDDGDLCDRERGESVVEIWLGALVDDEERETQKKPEKSHHIEDSPNNVLPCEIFFYQ